MKFAVSGGVIATLVVLAFYLKFNNPSESSAKFPPCVIRKFTGLYCPGCGATRSAHGVLNGNIAEAWRKNPAFVISLPFIVGGFLVPWLKWLLPWKAATIGKYTSFIPYRITWIALWVLVAFGILRNIPIEPFSLLAPR
jgi:hypothetical protein